VIYIMKKNIMYNTLIYKNKNYNTF